MTRKDYQLIADFIRSWIPARHRQAAAAAMAVKLSINPRFDANKFMEACK